MATGAWTVGCMEWMCHDLRWWIWYGFTILATFDRSILFILRIVVDSCFLFLLSRLFVLLHCVLPNQEVELKICSNATIFFETLKSSPMDLCSISICSAKQLLQDKQCGGGQMYRERKMWEQLSDWQAMQRRWSLRNGIIASSQSC